MVRFPGIFQCLQITNYFDREARQLNYSVRSHCPPQMSPTGMCLRTEVCLIASHLLAFQ